MEPSGYSSKIPESKVDATDESTGDTDVTTKDMLQTSVNLQCHTANGYTILRRCYAIMVLGPSLQESKLTMPHSKWVYDSTTVLRDYGAGSESTGK